MVHALAPRQVEGVGLLRFPSRMPLQKLCRASPISPPPGRRASNAQQLMHNAASGRFDVAR
eukprot:14942746-Alexandrium_andersonii.AAC.1